MRIGIVAGESSGDQLGAGLINAIREIEPDATFVGIAGPSMIAAGCNALHPAEKLSIFGLVDALINYRELSAIRDEVRDYFIADPPDVFIGIDAPDFNLHLLGQLKAKGIPTVQYVGPQIWAWRRYRVKKIARAVDKVLTLFPFEAKFYEEHAVPVSFVGHPFADKIPLIAEQTAAREKMDCPVDTNVIAILPGSRISEVKHLTKVFIETAQWCYAKNKKLCFIVPLASKKVRGIFAKQLELIAPDLPITLIDGNAREVMAASDAVLMASGTATLEAMLLKKPMVVAYKFSWLNYVILWIFSNVKYFSLPNLLADKMLIPEYVQADVKAEVMGENLLDYISLSDKRESLINRFTEIHESLKQGTDQRAAQAILDVIEQKRR